MVKGDMPIVRFNTAKILALGWANQPTSHEGMADAAAAMIAGAQGGKLYQRGPSSPQAG